MMPPRTPPPTTAASSATSSDSGNFSQSSSARLGGAVRGTLRRLRSKLWGNAASRSSSAIPLSPITPSGPSTSTARSPLLMFPDGTPSAEQLELCLRPPVMYQDPYVACTIDGQLHIANYLHDKMDDLRLPECRDIYSQEEVLAKKKMRLSRISELHYIRCSDLSDFSADSNVRRWGITRNGVWWAADPFRRRHIGEDTALIVLDDGPPFCTGFTVVSLTAFADCLRLLGSKAEWREGLPPLRIDDLAIPFIDQD